NIPAKGNFKITQIKCVSHPEQYISANFSEALQSDAFLDGLVELKKTSKSETSNDYYYDSTPDNYIKSTIINGNELKIYTSKKIGGEYELNIFPGIASAYGIKIDEPLKENVNFINLYPQVIFEGNGIIYS